MWSFGVFIDVNLKIYEQVVNMSMMVTSRLRWGVSAMHSVNNLYEYYNNVDTGIQMMRWVPTDI